MSPGPGTHLQTNAITQCGLGSVRAAIWQNALENGRVAVSVKTTWQRLLPLLPPPSQSLTVRPEGMFAHYLMMAAALGEHDFAAPGVQYGDYENSIGTSQVHVWFDRPETGWTRTGAAA